MSTPDQSSSGTNSTSGSNWARRAVGAVADFMDDWSYAQRRVVEVRLFGRDGNCAPDTYSEFLFRSPLALWREPTAKRRLAGASPRR